MFRRKSRWILTVPVFPVLIRGHAVFLDKSFIECIGTGIMDLLDNPANGKVRFRQQSGSALYFQFQQILMDRLMITGSK